MSGKDERKQEAFELYRQGLKLIDISKQLDVPEGTIRTWKRRGQWESQNETFQDGKRNVSKNKRGGQPGNKNAAGNDGGAPPANKNAEKHGFHSKWLPKETQEIINGMRDKQPLDILWEQIEIQYAAIIRSQNIMYVRDRDDKTTERIEEKSGDTSWGESWEVQQAWDKQANFLKAQSRAIAELRNMIKDYLELEGSDKKDAKENAKDWKQRIIEIAKKRAGDG